MRVIIGAKPCPILVNTLLNALKAIKQPQTTIDINDLPAGLYYYRVDTRLGIKTDKFIKQ